MTLLDHPSHCAFFLTLLVTFVFHLFYVIHTIWSNEKRQNKSQNGQQKLGKVSKNQTEWVWVYPIDLYIYYFFESCVCLLNEFFQYRNSNVLTLEGTLITSFEVFKRMPVILLWKHSINNQQKKERTKHNTSKMLISIAVKLVK